MCSILVRFLKEEKFLADCRLAYSRKAVACAFE